ncbi:MAG: FtsX-like permease family protein [Solirubrobacteraceae bacterium]
MGRLVLVSRLVIGDIKRRGVQCALLLLMIVTTTTTLTLAFALHGVTERPWVHTRALTKGPDVVATISPVPDNVPVSAIAAAGSGTLRRFAALADARGVVGSSGPFPLQFVALTWNGSSVQVEAEGRDRAPAAIDRPLLTAGRWVRSGGAVIEQGLADAIGLHVGDTIRVAGRSFRITGIAVSTAQPFYPASSPGVIWFTRAELRHFASSSRPLGYSLNLKLADPRTAGAFADEHFDPAWVLADSSEIRSSDAKVVTVEQRVLLSASVLLALLAIASIAVLVGGRMAEQTRRVGLLKAVGATPRLVAVMLLAENLLLALTAAVVGLAAGELLAPLLTDPGNGLLGGPGSPSLTAPSVAAVVLTAALVAAGATVAPAIRGARTSTVRALNDAANPPHRRPRLIAISARLPVPLLLGLRLIARRTRRTALSAASLTLAVAMIVAVLTMQHKSDTPDAMSAASGMLPGSSIADRISHVVFILSLILVVLAAINAIFTTWTTVIDALRPTALARALGATPRQISAGLTAAQLLPALAAACIGIPVGLLLYRIAGGGADSNPPVSWLLAVIPGTLIAVAGLTAIPARIGARRPPAETLQAE